MDYVRYLQAKKTVDDRALNLRVLQHFESFIASSFCNPCTPLRIVEIGAGIGAMFERLFLRKRLFENSNNVQYLLVDVKLNVLQAARHRISMLEVVDTQPVKSVLASHTLQHPINSAPTAIHVSADSDESVCDMSDLQLKNGISVKFVHADAMSFLKENKARFDVVIAAAVLDLWQLQPALQSILASLDPTSSKSCFYFPINFDGTTDLFPESSKGTEYDMKVENAFHIQMGHRLVLAQSVLACHTGRRLIPLLNSMKANLISVGSSTWIVSPSHHGKYHDDEAFFVKCILDFIQSAVQNSNHHFFQQDPNAFMEYMSSRHAQLSTGCLNYIAHNIDIFGTIDTAA